MSRLSSFLLGMVAGAGLLQGATTYHVVRADDGFHLVAKQPARLSETYVDIRAFTMTDWAGHPQLASALVQANQQQLLGDSAAGALQEQSQAVAAGMAEKVIARRSLPADHLADDPPRVLPATFVSLFCNCADTVADGHLPSPTARPETPSSRAISDGRLKSPRVADRCKKQSPPAIHTAARMRRAAIHPPVNRHCYGPESQSIFLHWIGRPAGRPAGALRQRLRAESRSDEIPRRANGPVAGRDVDVLCFRRAPPGHAKSLQPPEWLSWCLISVGAVLCLHSLAMPKPG